jgi:inward rectifier potassium channel
MDHKSNPRRLRALENTGFGANSEAEGTRLINKDGYANLRKTGVPFLEGFSLYHSLLRMSRIRFLLLVAAFYTCANLVFATIYFTIGIGHLTGTEHAVTLPERFLEAFFFSSQSLTTVGYGHVAPVGPLANLIAATESLVGIMLFALVTGMFYARFSRPRAYLMFSENMLVSPFRGGRALMLRVASSKNNHLTDLEGTVTAALHINENGKTVTKFFPVQLDIPRINSLALNWTLVHPLNEDSPMFGYTEADFRNSRIELIVSIKAFDDHYSNTVQQRTSFTVSDLVYGAKFAPMYSRSETGGKTMLALDKINDFNAVPLPEPESVPAVNPAVVDAKA